MVQFGHASGPVERGHWEIKQYFTTVVLTIVGKSPNYLTRQQRREILIKYSDLTLGIGWQPLATSCFLYSGCLVYGRLSWSPPSYAGHGVTPLLPVRNPPLLHLTVWLAAPCGIVACVDGALFVEYLPTRWEDLWLVKSSGEFFGNCIWSFVYFGSLWRGGVYDDYCNQFVLLIPCTSVDLHRDYWEVLRGFGQREYVTLERYNASASSGTPFCFGNLKFMCAWVLLDIMYMFFWSTLFK
jgi:hypothetical protein